VKGGYFADTVEAKEVDVDDLDDFEFEAPEIAPRNEGATSAAMQAYFTALELETRRAYAIAEQCRRQGLDPSTQVEIPPAVDLAARVEELLKDYLPQRGVAERIRELSKTKNREEVSLIVAKEVAAGKFGAYPTKETALDGGVRVGLAILTEGILVAPLEGIAGARILRNDDGTDCVALSFAGPIRAAGGTGQALSVLLADIVRRELGIGKYIPTQPEIDRLKEEIPAYKNAQHLQYNPTPAEIDLIAKACPVMIDGEGTEDEEVSGNRDLPRIESNRLRGGACLVMAEGLILKAPKIQKHVKNLKLDGWEFIDTFVNKGKDKKSEGPAPIDYGKPPIEVNPKYMAELVAGRPVFGHPSRKGAFRLRYGRARTAGLASTAIHPATMVIVDDFLAVGTQMKIERPGKATVATPCDTIEGPIVQLHNGSLVEVTTSAEARALKGRVRRIIDLGEILVPYGEFAENNKILPMSPYCVEWWSQELERASGAAPPAFKDAFEAVAFAERTRTPLHPAFNLFWHDLAPGEIRALSEFVLAKGVWRGGTLVLPGDEPHREALVTLGALHETVAAKTSGGRSDEGAGWDRSAVDAVEIANAPTILRLARHAYPLVRGLGLDLEEVEAARGGGSARIVRVRGPDVRVEGTAPPPSAPTYAEHVCGVVSALAGFRVRPRAPYRIGTRMGRPEKAAERKMSPPVHALFPLGEAGGVQRLVKDAAAKGNIEIEVGLRNCGACGSRTILNKCPREGCGGHTQPHRVERVEPQTIHLGDLLARAQSAIGLERLPETVKGVQGLISRTKTPEPLEKGLLRAKHEVFCFKDGTIRFDMTDVPLSHFKPREIHTSVEKLVALGYTHDVRGEPLARDDQILELKVQDVLLSTAGMDYMLRAAQYVDDLLAKMYGLKPYYDCREPEDLVGHLIVGLAPHTSGGVLGRLIGHTKAAVGFAHPYFHAAKRRNCDGDEDCLMLLLDGLVNFSRAYLPDNRGGLMDAPLTLTLRLDPSEVDKEAHNVDVGWRYPLEFYEATTKHPGPKDVEKLVDTVAKRLGTPKQYEGLGFTHDTADIAEGPAISAYKSIGDMMSKMEAQLELAARIRAVDAPDVAALVIGSHFLPDLMGNLKAFSKQKVRCTKCSAKYRRIPLAGHCLKCRSALTMTVHEGSVRKYLEVSKQICERYGVNHYVRQRIEHIEESIESVFSNDRVKKAKLSDFF